MTRVDHRGVILDLNRDRYIGVSNKLIDAILEFHKYPRSDIIINKRLKHNIDQLVNLGVINKKIGINSGRNSCSMTDHKRTLPQPTKSIWARLSDERTSDEPISYAGMASALVSLALVATSLRIRSFKSTIDWLERTESEVERGRSNSSAQTLVDSFDEVRPYFPIKPICRLDAPSLCLHLRRNRHEAYVVFGVRLDPFAAHCWVQKGDVAINEAWTNARQYSPILVV